MSKILNQTSIKEKEKYFLKNINITSFREKDKRLLKNY